LTKPKLGDVARGRELGRRPPHAVFTYTACVKCGKGRWVRTLKGNKLLHSYCVKCSPRSTAQKCPILRDLGVGAGDAYTHMDVCLKCPYEACVYDKVKGSQPNGA
jgi:hypothetical protein